MDKLLFYLKHNVIDWYRFPKYRNETEEKVNSVAKQSNMSNKQIWRDIRKKCYISKGNYEDYFYYDMNLLTKEECCKQLTMGRYYEYIFNANTPYIRQTFSNKTKFNKIYADYIRRDYINTNDCTDEQLEQFIAKHPVFVAKPNSGSSGTGVQKVNASDFKDTAELREFLTKNRLSLLEELIISNQEIAAFNPSSVNSLRVFTYLDKNNKPHVAIAVLKMGTTDGITDNISLNGICASINLETGIIEKPAISKTKHMTYNEHPVSHKKIVGFKIPEFDKVKKFVCDAALVSPEGRIIGWDVAIAKDGPMLIEANSAPDHTFFHTTDPNNSKEIFFNMCQNAGLKRSKFSIRKKSGTSHK